MNLKTCLLVTDDPDDQQAFTEALDEIFPSAILIVVLNSEKAQMLLLEKKLLPDYLFLDLTMYGIKADAFIKTLKTDPALLNVEIVVYGEIGEFKSIHANSVTLFSKEYDYGELRSFLKRTIKIV